MTSLTRRLLADVAANPVPTETGPATTAAARAFAAHARADALACACGRTFESGRALNLHITKARRALLT